MRVHKSTKIDIGGGTSREIIEAIKAANLPDEAAATKVETDFSDVLAEGLLGFTWRNYTNMTFEWEVDE